MRRYGCVKRVGVEVNILLLQVPARTAPRLAHVMQSNRIEQLKPEYTEECNYVHLWSWLDVRPCAPLHEHVVLTIDSCCPFGILQASVNDVGTLASSLAPGSASRGVS